MMYCSYHAKNPAVVQCNQCARWLCPACDHRVRGFPFCQDCIVAGVELLRHSHASPSNILRRKSSPFVATLLSFVPVQSGKVTPSDIAKPGRVGQSLEYVR